MDRPPVRLTKSDKAVAPWEVLVKVVGEVVETGVIAVGEVVVAGVIEVVDQVVVVGEVMEVVGVTLNRVQDPMRL